MAHQIGPRPRPERSRPGTSRPGRLGRRCAPAALLLLALAGAAPAAAPAAGEERTTAILAINDVYRIQGVDDGDSGGLARVRDLRRELEANHPELLLLHAGDALAPSLISRLYRGEFMVRTLNLLDGAPGVHDPRMFVVFGNHEFDDKSCPNLRRRLEESEFTWLDTNIDFAPCVDAEELRRQGKLAKNVVVASGGIRIGIFGVTTSIKKQDYIQGFGEPIETARDQSRLLRGRGAEVVVALTHLAMAEDRRILGDLEDAGPDLIVGGHDHERMYGYSPEGRPVFKADADARTASVVRLTLGAGAGLDLRQEYRMLVDRSFRPDPRVAAEVAGLVAAHESRFCDENRMEPGCLGEPLGRTRTELVGEENRIRRQETSLGTWVAAVMRAAYAECGARAAFINSGALRLNEDLPADSAITRRHLETLIQYDAELQLIEIDGATLEEVIDNAVVGWPGSGRWLQVSGFAFVHDGADQGGRSASGLTLVPAAGDARPIAPGERLRIVTVPYVLDPTLGDQDGYTMLSLDQRVADCGVAPPSLKAALLEDLERSGERGIAPEAAGLICEGRGAPGCRAVSSAGAPGSSPSPMPLVVVLLVLAAALISWPVLAAALGMSRSP